MELLSFFSRERYINWSKKILTENFSPLRKTITMEAQIAGAEKRKTIFIVATCFNGYGNSPLLVNFQCNNEVGLDVEKNNKNENKSILEKFINK